mgnify:CR=1 FL=1|jgi:preprotein translocase subunit SecE
MARKDEEKDDELNEDEESLGSDASSEERDDDRSEDESESPQAHQSEKAEHLREDLAAEADLLAHESTETAAEQLGASVRYVHAAFFVAGILVAFISSKLLGMVWGELADWPAATRAVPLLLRFAEDERGGYVLGAGALIGVLAVVQSYRKEHIRRWADEVALELTKVTWPNREAVSNGTVVVLVATAIATAYVALLDRFWGFLTHLVYGA